MLEQLLEDNFSTVPASNQPVFDRETDYAAILEASRLAGARWGALGKAGQAAFKDVKQYLESESIRSPQDPALLPAKHYHMMQQEVSRRLEGDIDFQPLPLDAVDFDESALELAESIENATFLRQVYKQRKKTTGDSKNAGINDEEAIRLKNCLVQGRELYIAGRNGSLMVKPLNYFYSMTAYAYGIIVLNNPLRFKKSNLPGSHGLSYLPDTMQARFGGDTARGTFSDLVSSFPTQALKGRSVSLVQDCSESVFQLFSNRIDTSVGTLLSLVPEMSEYYKLTTGRPSRAHLLDIVQGADPRVLKWEFQIGNGDNRPSSLEISNAFPGFPVSERQGRTIVVVPASEASKIKACLFTDVRGRNWFIENPFFPIILPEIAVHFLITNIFSNIMRYRPDEWGHLISNEVPSAVSLLVRHYFLTFQRKMLPLTLKSLSPYFPYVGPE